MYWWLAEDCWLVEDWPCDALGHIVLAGVINKLLGERVFLAFTTPERAQQFMASEIAKEPFAAYPSGELAVVACGREGLKYYVDQHPEALVVLDAPPDVPLSSSIPEKAMSMQTFVDSA